MVKFRRLKNKDIENNALVRWLTYLNETTPPNIIEELIKMDTAIQKTNERYDFLSQDKETLHRYHLRQIGQMDWNSVVYERDQNRQRAEQAEHEREQERQRAEQAEKRVEQEQQRAEQNRVAMEQERQHAEQERQRAEQAKQRIAELEAQLRDK